MSLRITLENEAKRALTGAKNQLSLKEFLHISSVIKPEFKYNGISCTAIFEGNELQEIQWSYLDTSGKIKYKR